MKIILYLLAGMTILLFYNPVKDNSMILFSNDHSNQTERDTAIYNSPEVTAELPNAINYFLENNKYKDWNVTDRKVVFLQGIVEIDGTITGIKIIKSSQIDDLDKEAIRLINSAKYNPGKNKNKNVRSKISIPVFFPPQNVISK